MVQRTNYLLAYFTQPQSIIFAESQPVVVTIIHFHCHKKVYIKESSFRWERVSIVGDSFVPIKVIIYHCVIVQTIRFIQ